MKQRVLLCLFKFTLPEKSTEKPMVVVYNHKGQKSKSCISA